MAHRPFTRDEVRDMHTVTTEVEDVLTSIDIEHLARLWEHTSDQDLEVRVTMRVHHILQLRDAYEIANRIVNRAETP